MNYVFPSLSAFNNSTSTRSLNACHHRWLFAWTPLVASPNWTVFSFVTASNWCNVAHYLFHSDNQSLISQRLFGNKLGPTAKCSFFPRWQSILAHPYTTFFVNLLFAPSFSVGEWRDWKGRQTLCSTNDPAFCCCIFLSFWVIFGNPFNDCLQLIAVGRRCVIILFLRINVPLLPRVRLCAADMKQWKKR